MVNIGENIPESLETKIMDIPLDVDSAAKIRSGLSITVLEKKNSTELSLKKSPYVEFRPYLHRGIVQEFPRMLNFLTFLVYPQNFQK